MAAITEIFTLTEAKVFARRFMKNTGFAFVNLRVMKANDEIVGVHFNRNGSHREIVKPVTPSKSEKQRQTEQDNAQYDHEIRMGI